MRYFLFVRLSKKREEALQAVRTAFSCRSPDQTLQAKGNCNSGRSAVQGASCGPSYDYVESSGRCRQIFEDEKLVVQLSVNDGDDNHSSKDIIV